MANVDMSQFVALIDPSLTKATVKGVGPTGATKEERVKALFEEHPPQLLGEIPKGTPGGRILTQIRALQRGETVVSAEKGATKALPILSMRRPTAEEKQAGTRPYNLKRGALDGLKVVASLGEAGVPADTLVAYLAFAPEGTTPFLERVPEGLRRVMPALTCEVAPQLTTQGVAGRKGKEPEAPKSDPIACDREWLEAVWCAGLAPEAPAAEPEASADAEEAAPRPKRSRASKTG